MLSTLHNQVDTAFTRWFIDVVFFVWLLKLFSSVLSSTRGGIVRKALRGKAHPGPLWQVWLAVAPHYIRDNCRAAQWQTAHVGAS